MKLSTLLIVNSVLAFGFGLAFLGAPGPLALQYGVALDAGGQFVARLLGAAFIGYGVLTLHARSAAEDERAVQSIRLSLAIANGLGGAATAVAALQGVGNAMLWTSVVLYAGLAVAFAIPAAKRAGAPA